MSKLPEIITPREMGDALRISESTVRNMANRGELPEAVKIGGKWVIHSSAVQRLKPRPATVSDQWQDADAQKSQLTKPPAATGASDGARTAASSKTEDSSPRTKRKTTRTSSASAFAQDFPEHAKTARSANSLNTGGTRSSRPAA